VADVHVVHYNTAMDGSCAHAFETRGGTNCSRKVDKNVFAR